MFENLRQALDFIENQRIKRTLEQFKETLEKYGFKRDYENVIHITGTNGKGSTTKYLQLILNNHGYRVGTFTSPYLVKHNDRVCIDGEMIGDNDLLSIINNLLEIIKTENLSMFEIDLLIALEWFKDKNLDYLIFEAGIGGLNDKTNIFNSKISAITNVALDHQEMLGNTIEEICVNKMGIIRNDSIFVTTETNPKMTSLMAQRCQELNTKFVKIDPTKIILDGEVLEFNFEPGYQQGNGALAIAIARCLVELERQKVLESLAGFSLPLHFERIDKFILDGSHNPAGIKALVESIKGMTNVAIIFSALDDKDVETMNSLFGNYPIYHSSFHDFRQKRNKNEKFTDTVSKIYKKYDTIILTGSIHFVSCAREYLGGRFHGK